jgi:hypothetical protein
MLIEEQAAALLARCEKILGIELRQTRGNLRNAESRAAAVWELLVIEEAADIGYVEYEPHPGASPDIRLTVNNHRPLWIEAAYLYPRFWDEERRSYAITSWLTEEIERRGLPSGAIRLRFDGRRSTAGYKRALPGLHEKSTVLKHPDLLRFFDGILSDRTAERECILEPYSIRLSYASRDARGVYYGISGGLVQEAATLVSENAVYRRLDEKAGQHNVSGPRIICIGSDQSGSLSILNGVGTGRPSGIEAGRAALRQHRSIAGALIVTIENRPDWGGRYSRSATPELIINRHAHYQLTDEEIVSLTSMRFDRWDYSYLLRKWDSGAPEKQFRRASGSLTMQNLGVSVKIRIPANLVVDALAGKTSVAQAFDLSPEEARVFNEGWSVVSCELEEGNIEAARAPRLVLELVPPPLAVYWPRKKQGPE